MSTKKISVNPAFFKINGSKTLKKREKREKSELAKKENKELKMKLINKIKEHKKRKQQEEREKTIPNDGLENELEKSLNYLQDLSTKHKSKKQKRRERKLARRLERQQSSSIKVDTNNLLQTPLIPSPNPPPRAYIVDNPSDTQNLSSTNTSTLTLNPIITPNALSPPQNIPLQPQLVSEPRKPDPPYGILKHGKKPLFSMYNKTLKKPTSSNSSYRPSIHINSNSINNSNMNTNINNPIHTDDFFERKQKLQQLKQHHQGKHLSQSIKSQSVMPNRSKTMRKMKQLTTTTKRFIHLGKKNGKVGVLIKNQKTRKKILKDTNTLKKRPLSKIKQYLRKHNLIKIGSTAPEHIIRSIYENSFLSGDVYNKNIDTLLHNYLDK